MTPAPITADLIKQLPICGFHPDGDAPALPFVQLGDGVAILACPRCGRGGVMLSAKQWRLMRSRRFARGGVSAKQIRAAQARQK